VITLPCPDAKELLRVRNGEYSYGAVLAYAESFLGEVDTMAEHSPLPKKADYDKVLQLYLDLVAGTLERIK
jgi:hypothetical protein